MRWIFGLLFLGFYSAYGQYEIGETSIVFTDSERDREIETFIYYPADETGTDVAVSEGTFPVIAFGHGFVMTYASYEFLWEELVPRGYILAFPNTETTFDVSHEDFSLDLGFVIEELQTESATEGTLFYEHVSVKSAVMGHSMGGGAAVLAMSAYPEISTLVTFAAAETDPSAIAAAENITKPSLTFAGAADCVTPPAEHQEPIYANLSDCKGYVLIAEASHCQFANSNALCEFGEFACPSPEISEGEQHLTIMEVLTPWLEAYLKMDFSAWEAVEALEGDQGEYNLTLDCTENAPSLSLEDQGNEELTVYPNPTDGFIFLSTTVLNGNYVVYAMDGKVVQEGNLTAQKINVSGLKSGCYILKIESDEALLLNQRILKE